MTDKTPSSAATIAIPSKGRLRELVLDLLRDAGYRTGGLTGRTSSTTIDDIQFIEMRTRDAAIWMAAGRLDAAFISTDTALEAGVDHLPTIELGVARSDLVVACRDADRYASIDDLRGATVATHLPKFTARWLEQQGVDCTVISMGGSLEGVCAVGLADAIVDLRETGASLERNRLRVIADIKHCQATFVSQLDPAPVIDDLVLRVGAALEARRTQYLMLHIPAAQVGALSEIFHGLESPTVLPLAGRDDLVAAHMVVERAALWRNLSALRSIGASGIVAVPNDAMLP